ncbi:hypothetical protein HOY80DRAFT_1082593 [Tuber brumale]|nr:hypothetical protein HOY80DRAFT_1082593 [Tuber brumale]
MAHNLSFHCPECNTEFKIKKIEVEKVVVAIPPPHPAPTGILLKMLALIDRWIWEAIQFCQPTVLKEAKIAFDMVCGGWNLTDFPIAGCPKILLPFINHTFHYASIFSACLSVIICLNAYSCTLGWLLRFGNWIWSGCLWFWSCCLWLWERFLWLHFRYGSPAFYFPNPYSSHDDPDNLPRGRQLQNDGAPEEEGEELIDLERANPPNPDVSQNQDDIELLGDAALGTSSDHRSDGGEAGPIEATSIIATKRDAVGNCALPTSVIALPPLDRIDAKYHHRPRPNTMPMTDNTICD